VSLCEAHDAIALPDVVIPPAFKQVAATVLHLAFAFALIGAPLTCTSRYSTTEHQISSKQQQKREERDVNTGVNITLCGGVHT
jgi:hypothetical protein